MCARLTSKKTDSKIMERKGYLTNNTIKTEKSHKIVKHHKIVKPHEIVKSRKIVKSCDSVIDQRVFSL
jgi:hypothetical protein